MSNYYDYRKVKVMIAHELMKLDGWKVYGYKEDESDSMTDYYDPANWDGIAEKNGYILCVDVYGASKEKEIKKYNRSTFTYDKNITEKINKLQQMTVERGASEQEEKSAKTMIERLQKKAEESTENSGKYIVTGIIPAHMAHPNKCNWHIEKDGIIIAKGNGILKYTEVYYDIDNREISEYLKDKRAYAEKNTRDLLERGYYSDEERARKSTESHINDIESKLKVIDSFRKFINKLDTTCGCLVGEGEIEQYEIIKKTEYKAEIKAVETSNGSIKDGQCFMLKTNFNYGCSKGLVYRIHESVYNDKTYYHAYKLNGKLTKECTGRANSNNNWGTFGDTFIKWIEKGSIGWCELQEVKTPYEVEKVVKKVI